MSSGFIRHYLILWCLNDNSRYDFHRSFYCNTLGISLRTTVHPRKSFDHNNVYLAFHGDVFKYSLSWSSRGARYSNKILFLLSVSFQSLSSYNVFFDKHTHQRDTLVHQYLFAQANSETYHKDKVTSYSNGLG